MKTIKKQERSEKNICVSNNRLFRNNIIKKKEKTKRLEKVEKNNKYSEKKRRKRTMFYTYKSIVTSQYYLAILFRSL